ncbi:MAG: hypothetical protein IAE82_13340 [Opitutaceae bacterium]|nr:hypothetical protein [Opitutaceae bacterium]
MALILLISGMANSGEGGAWQRIKTKIVDAVVQDCPPSLAACEVCRRMHCDDPHWLACERRLAAERHLRAGEHAALESLRAGHRCTCVGPGAEGLRDDNAAC